MNGFISKQDLTTWIEIQNSVIGESKRYAAAAPTASSREIREEDTRIQVEMMKVIEDLYRDFSRLEVLLSEVCLQVKEFYPDAAARKVKCIDLGGNIRIFNYRFTSELLEIFSEFGRPIIRRYLWSETFKEINEGRYHYV